VAGSNLAAILRMRRNRNCMVMAVKVSLSV